jgi:hypothetical protein
MGKLRSERWIGGYREIQQHMGELVEWEKSGVVAETDRTPSSAEVARRSGRLGGRAVMGG